MENLPVHLPDQQTIVFEEGDEEGALRAAEGNETKLTAYFRRCCEDPEARRFTYLEFPKHYTWYPEKGNHHWAPRQRRQETTLARLMHVSPSDCERFGLRLLLAHVPGVRSFNYLLKLNGRDDKNFLEAAIALGLWKDDRYCAKVMSEVTQRASWHEIIQTFVWLCVHSAPPSPLKLWEEFKALISMDFTRHPYNFSVEQAEARALSEIERMLLDCGHTLERHGLPSARQHIPERPVFTPEQHAKLSEEMWPTLNNEQKAFAIDFLNAFGHRDQQSRLKQTRLFYLEGAAGTGKTHVYRYLFHTLKSLKINVVCLALTGIAATLLPEGRTIHSVFKIPLNLTDTSTSFLDYSKDPEAYNFVRDLQVIIIDEISMVSKQILDIISMTLNFLEGTSLVPYHWFGDKFVIFGGDMRQILTVVPGGGRAEIVRACFKSSDIWRYGKFRTYHLTQNMRVNPAEREFAQFLLRLGNGELNVRIPNVTDNALALPERLIMPWINDEDNELALIKFVFAEHLTVESVRAYEQHVILCPTNEACLRINSRIIETILEGPAEEYLSADNFLEPTWKQPGLTAGAPDADRNAVNAAADLEFARLKLVNENTSVDVLHAALPEGSYPPHRMLLKVGTVVIFLRNMMLNRGIANGTRARVVALLKESVEVEILSGKCAREIFNVPKIKFYHTKPDASCPYEFLREQLPIKPAFAMTIHKSQGGTFHRVGVYLESLPFAHGLLYVALSRCRDPNNLRVLIKPTLHQGYLQLLPGEAQHFTDNVVYAEVLERRDFANSASSASAH